MKDSAVKNVWELYHKRSGWMHSLPNSQNKKRTFRRILPAERTLNL